jgi:hypothetical protein
MSIMCCFHVCDIQQDDCVLLTLEEQITRDETKGQEQQQLDQHGCLLLPLFPRMFGYQKPKNL